MRGERKGGKESKGKGNKGSREERKMETSRGKRKGDKDREN